MPQPKHYVAVLIEFSGPARVAPNSMPSWEQNLRTLAAAKANAFAEILDGSDAVVVIGKTVDEAHRRIVEHLEEDS